MNTPDPRFVVQLAEPVTFRGVTFAAVRVEILDGAAPKSGTGYRVRPLRDIRPEDSTEPDPVWQEIAGEYFAADLAPTEENALAVIEAFLAGPSEADQLAAAKVTLIARATHRRWEVEVGGITLGGMAITTDDRSKTLLLQADREAREHDTGARWKVSSGVWVDLTAAQVRACAAALSDHVRACFAREEELHALINTSPDFATLNALKPTVETFTA